MQERLVVAGLKLLGRHKKPIMIANIDGFWQPLCALLDHMKQLQFIRDGLNVDLLVADRVDDILPKLTAAVRAIPEVWIAPLR